MAALDPTLIPPTRPEGELESGRLGSAGAIPAVFVDFSLVGIVTRFRTWMADQRRKLSDGQEITVYGDAVDAVRARVIHVDPDDPEVEIELLDAA